MYTYVPPPEGLYESPTVSFYGKKRIEVPGAVAVNRPPYVCDLDRRTFRAKEPFVAHLWAAHGSQLDRSSQPFVVHQGQVHFVAR